jgi:DNA primase
VQPVTKATMLAAADEAAADSLREAVILAALVTHPGLVERFESALETLELLGPDHNALRDALLRCRTRAEIEEAVGPGVLEKLFSARHVRNAPGARDGDGDDLAAQCIVEGLAKLSARRGADREIREAMEDLAELADEGLTWRLAQAAAAQENAGRSGQEDRTEFDIAPNGVRLNREERDALDKLLRDAGISGADERADK